MGELSVSDLQQPYRSAASNTFRSYIVDPEATKDETDRNLYKRYKGCSIISKLMKKLYTW